MPTEQDGIHAFLAAKVLFGPSKAANAGGVAVSGLEISQNQQRLSWEADDLQKQLRSIKRTRVDPVTGAVELVRPPFGLTNRIGDT